MEINGSQSIAAPRQQVWDALNDPVVLKACLPGCESVERVSPEEFRVIMAAAIGPLRARFNGKLQMTESRPPESCLMTFEGQGGVVGFGKGSSSVSLADTADGTTLSYTANAQVGGKLAQVGSRLIDNVARKMAEDFFSALRRQLVPAEVPVEPAAEVPTLDSSAAAVPPANTASPSAHAGTTTAVQRPATPVAQAPQGTSVALVPAWWLAVAVVLGAVVSLAGVVVAR